MSHQEARKGPRLLNRNYEKYVKITLYSLIILQSVSQLCFLFPRRAASLLRTFFLICISKKNLVTVSLFVSFSPLLGTLILYTARFIRETWKVEIEKTNGAFFGKVFLRGKMLFTCLQKRLLQGPKKKKYIFPPFSFRYKRVPVMVLFSFLSPFPILFFFVFLLGGKTEVG